MNPQKSTILCVDDSSASLLVCKAILEAHGYKVLTADNGATGLDILKRHLVSTVVTDNDMPGMTGVELASEIKHLYQNLPILMFSGSHPAGDAAIDRFVYKGTGVHALLNAVESLVRTGNTGRDVTRNTSESARSGLSSWAEDKCMLFSASRLAFLKHELEFLESGGYREHPQRWLPPLLFEDGPNCRFTTAGGKPLCHACPLIGFVPLQHRAHEVPCRHIALDGDGRTIDSMYQTATQKELEMELGLWLKKQIIRMRLQKIKQRFARQQAALAAKTDGLYAAAASGAGARLKEMMDWAEKIDPASYDSVEMAVRPPAPLQRRRVPCA